MKKTTSRGRKKPSEAAQPAGRRKKVAAASTLLPLAISMIPAAMSLRQPAQPAAVTQPAPQASRAGAVPKKFSIPVTDLRAWASAVLVTINDVTIEGNSKVHKPDADCEIHFGAHTTNFNGRPAGLVLEPMNACSLPFPGKTEQKDADWIDFANRIKNKSVTVTGVPRIWPEHLTGGGASNPDHAVEVHPLTAVVSDGKTLDFSGNVSAGEYRGGVGLPTAQSIVKQTSVTLVRNGNNADINFFGGRIGNFTVLDLLVNRLSIQADAAGSFRMNGEVLLDDGTSVPVHMVSIKNSPFNDDINEIRSNSNEEFVNLGEVLVLFSLSPEALLEAANQSNGQPLAVSQPLQLILFGPPEG